MIADLLYRSGEYVTAENVAKSSLRAHRDWCGWASAHFAASAITSDVYTGIGVSGLVTLRMQ